MSDDLNLERKQLLLMIILSYTYAAVFWKYCCMLSVKDSIAVKWSPVENQNGSPYCTVPHTSSYQHYHFNSYFPISLSSYVSVIQPTVPKYWRNWKHWMMTSWRTGHCCLSLSHLLMLPVLMPLCSHCSSQSLLLLYHCSMQTVCFHGNVALLFTFYSTEWIISAVEFAPAIHLLCM